MVILSIMLSQKAKDWFEREHGCSVAEYAENVRPASAVDFSSLQFSSKESALAEILGIPGYVPKRYLSSLEIDRQNEVLAEELARPIGVQRRD